MPISFRTSYTNIIDASTLTFNYYGSGMNGSINVSEDDLMLVTIIVTTTDANVSCTITPPSVDWNLVNIDSTDSSYVPTGKSIKMFVYAKFVTSADLSVVGPDKSFTFGLSGTNCYGRISMCAFSGVYKGVSITESFENSSIVSRYLSSVTNFTDTVVTESITAGTNGETFVMLGGSSQFYTVNPSLLTMNWSDLDPPNSIYNNATTYFANNGFYQYLKNNIVATYLTKNNTTVISLDGNATVNSNSSGAFTSIKSCSAYMSLVPDVPNVICLRTFYNNPNLDASSLTIDTTGVFENDLMIVNLLVSEFGDLVPEASATTPSGWTLINDYQSSAPWWGKLFVYARFATNSEPVNYTFNFTSGDANRQGKISMYSFHSVYRNISDILDSFEYNNNYTNSGQTTNASSVSNQITTSTNGLVFLMLGGYRGGLSSNSTIATWSNWNASGVLTEISDDALPVQSTISALRYNTASAYGYKTDNTLETVTGTTTLSNTYEWSMFMIGLVPETGICLRFDTKVKTPNGYVLIKDIKSHDNVIDQHGNIVEVLYNIVGGHRNDFIKITKDAFGDNKPDQDLFITDGHPLWINDNEIECQCLLNNDSVQKITIDAMEEVYSICTKERIFVVMNNVDVCTWSHDEFKKACCKSNRSFRIK